jgi:alpha-D-xyloside xylohydrolase
MRQVYGVLWQREIEKLFHAANRRTFGLVRGSNGGATRFPFAIYSDSYDHREYIAGMTGASLAGVMWCAEARSAANGEEWVRRMQTAVVSHVAQLNAWSDGTKPWSFPGAEEAVKKAMLLRITLVPYLYTAFAQHHFEGTPVIRPMALVDGGLETDQFLLGDDLLVAPMFVGAKSRKVRLPAGRWFDFETGQPVGTLPAASEPGGTASLRGETIEITPPLDKIPIFVREGALIPTLSPRLRAGAPWKEGELIVRRYGVGPAHGLFYEDDGETFAYEKGEFAWRRLEWNGGESGSGIKATWKWIGR